MSVVALLIRWGAWRRLTFVTAWIALQRDWLDLILSGDLGKWLRLPLEKRTEVAKGEFLPHSLPGELHDLLLLLTLVAHVEVIQMLLLTEDLCIIVLVSVED